MTSSHQDLEARIARLEIALNVAKDHSPLSDTAFLISLALLGGGLACGYLGMGQPNHPYQWALGGMATALAYHRRWFRAPAKSYEWLLAPLNVLMIAMLFKLLIGSGIHQPFAWIKVPEITNTSSGMVPSWSLVWQPSTVGGWELDLTLIQTFLLLITLIGALFRFQPFVSLTALLLIVVSLPAFASFTWTWVFPSMAVAAVAFYVQGTGLTQEED